ncbi:MAG: hypothetical protein RL065_1875 [Bacteroidota bacterium]
MLFTQSSSAISRWGYRQKPISYWDYSYKLGLGNYVGDLVPSFNYPNQLHPWTGFSARWNYNNHWSLKSSLDLGGISGDDKKSGNTNRYIRNLNFKSGIQELSFLGEANILPFHAYKGKNSFTLYLETGIAGFHFNPKTLYNGKWTALQPLGTEGQGIPGYPKKYQRLSIAIPFGGGLKYRIKIGYERYITICTEVVIRKTFTDYLDDVSDKYIPLSTLKKYNGQASADLSIKADEYLGYPVDYTFDTRRGDRTTKDWYFSSFVTISYVFREASRIIQVH